MSTHDEIPTGILETDHILSEDERQDVIVIKAINAMMAAYVGTVPFPKFVEQYVQSHQLLYNFRSLAQFVMPPNDPRRKKHDGNLDVYKSYMHATVEWYPYADPDTPRISISGGYEFEEMFLDPQQALSLLDWLRQEEVRLKALVKEQEHDA